MAFTGTAIEIMALIVIVVSAIKIIVLLVNPKAWVNSVVKKVWANSSLAMIVSLVLAGITLYFLIQGGITIVQILAVMLFIALLGAVGATMYANEVVGLAEKLLKDKNIIKKSWLYIVLWVILLAWGAKELFM